MAGLWRGWTWAQHPAGTGESPELFSITAGSCLLCFLWIWVLKASSSAHVAQGYQPFPEDLVGSCWISFRAVWGTCPHTWAVPLLPSHSPAAMQGQNLMLRIWAFSDRKFSVYFLHRNLIPRTAYKKNIFTHTAPLTDPFSEQGLELTLFPFDVGQTNLPEQGDP